MKHHAALFAIAFGCVFGLATRASGADVDGRDVTADTRADGGRDASLEGDGGAADVDAGSLDATPSDGGADATSDAGRDASDVSETPDGSPLDATAPEDGTSRDATDIKRDAADGGPRDADDVGGDTEPADARLDTDDAVGDVSSVDADLDAARDVDADARDGGRDAAMDVADGRRDATPRDVSDDVAAPPDDAGDAGRDVDDGAPGDDVRPMDAVVRRDGTIDADAAPRARFSGRVSLQSSTEADGVEVTLERRLDGDRTESVGTRTTGPDGAFVFEELPFGRYQIRLEKSGFVTAGETFDLSGDRRQTYRLFEDQSVDLRVLAQFPEGTSPPSTVDFELEGPRGTIRPDDPVSVEDREAVWTRETLGVGRWTIRASASDFRTIAFSFDARGESDERRRLSIRLQMRPVDRGSLPVEEESGCSCGGDGAGGGGGFPGAPGGRLSMVFLVGLGLWLMRMRRRR